MAGLPRRASVPASRDERNPERYSRKDSEDSVPVLLGHRQAWKAITAVPTLHAGYNRGGIRGPFR